MSGERLKLYSYLDRLDEKAIYCDTDSVIYVHKETDAPLVESGDRLVDMTNELRLGEYVEEFVSGTPKNYTYRAVGDKTVCKVRGITFNYTSSQPLNFIGIRDMILRGREREQHELLVHTEKKVKRKKRPRQNIHSN